MIFVSSVVRIEMKRVAENIAQFASRFKYMASLVKKWPVQISLIEGYNERSDKQNRTFHMHFKEAAKYFGWTPEYAKRFAKYNYGLPILAGRCDKNGELTEDGKYWSDLL